MNYEAHVYINGKKIGYHVGGFTPFNFEVTNDLKEKDNILIVKVDNKRKREGVPTVNTDWWNYGGITRDVALLEQSATFIEDYFIQLKKGSLEEVEGWVKWNGPSKAEKVKIRIPELKFEKEYSANEGRALVSFTQKFQLWSPSNPKLYEVFLIYSKDTIRDRIGFRSIETKGQDILLNGKPVFLKGICIHE